jgi:hypothetical protein
MPDRTEVALKSAWVKGIFLVIPYLLIGISWATSNPPIAAPDEQSHLIKALGIAHFDIGTPWLGHTDPPIPINIRNDSLSREVEIPAQLDPRGYSCFAFYPDVTAACQYARPENPSEGTVVAVTPMGAYPPFEYFLIGQVAQFGTSLPAAVLLGRFTVLIICCLLLTAAFAHIIAWLGRRAILGALLGLTPMAVFCSGILSISGFEIYSGLAVAAVVVVAMRRPESLDNRSTQVLLMVSGAVLALSRQLGVLTLAILVLVLLATGGWRPILAQLRSGRVSAWITVAVLGISTGLALWWESVFDNPALRGPVFATDSLVEFMNNTGALTDSAVGWLGWVDVILPDWVLGIWLALLAGMITIGYCFGRTQDRVVLIVSFLATVAVAYVVYSTIFWTVDVPTIQGRHVLGLFQIVPLLAGVVAAERLSPAVFRRLLGIIAIFVPIIQGIALYFNARRYAVGSGDQPIWFFPISQWEPAWGWWLTLGIGLAGVMTLFVAIRSLSWDDDRSKDSFQSRETELESVSVER